MKRLIIFTMSLFIMCLEGCSGASQTSHGILDGIQYSSGMSQEEIDQESEQGQMRNIH